MKKPAIASSMGNNLLAGLVSTLLLTSPVVADESVEEYLDLPLEDLLSMQVTSVSKKKQPLNEVASAVFVITQDDIRRSGVTSIPEALRMAPGIQVSRIDANKWAIASRGFASQFSNKLLVMIDGRTVYSPAYSGVYWDAQDTLLEDIDRIEVIRGPGATVWGANAVNGVINIITKQASATQGGLLVAGAGNEEKGFTSLRYGAELSPQIHGRAYLKYNDRDGSYAPALEGDAGDDWQSVRGGFRIDGQTGVKDDWTFQGDIYDDDENQTINVWKDPTDPANAGYAPFFLAANSPDAVASSGWNLLGKWNHRISATANTTLQIYYDHTRRSEYFLTQTHDTLDLDFQHQFRPLEAHDVIWGLEYRHVGDEFNNSFMASFLPDSQNTDLFSAFVQDEIELVPRTLRLTLGSKFEHNVYTGLEVQPSARLVWLPSERSTLWGSISRAVRIPSRVEQGSQIISQIIPLPSPVPPFFNPVVFHVYGNEDFRSEEVLAYEAGYRVQPRENLSIDLALFYNDYDTLQTFEQINPSSPLPDMLFSNGMSAQSYGLELSLDWRPLEWWQLQPNYSFLHISSELDAGSSDQAGSAVVAAGSSPRNQFSIRSMMDLGNRVSLDAWVYYVGKLKQTGYSWDDSVDSYTSVNARLAWRPLNNVELSLVGQNLLDGRHAEFVGENLHIKTEVERSIYGQIRWDF